MASMTPDQMDAFLARTRQAILLTTTPGGSPTGVPVWFDWDGDTVRFFSNATAPKVATIEADPRIALLVTNDVDEAPAWVRFEGRATVDRAADARHLAVDVLAPRYWDLSEPAYASVVERWAAAPEDALVVIGLTPDVIRSSG